MRAPPRGDELLLLMTNATRMGGILSPLYLSELLIRLEPWVLEHPQGYIYNPPKPSFDKEGFRGHEFSLIGITK